MSAKNKEGVSAVLPSRKQMILKAIIENYIDTAEPVGSKALMGAFEKPLSSATIRNEMSELEEMGLLEKQHLHKHMTIRLVQRQEKADLNSSRTMQLLMTAKES